MIIDLSPYGLEIVLAYLVSLSLLVALVFSSWIAHRKVSAQDRGSN